MEQRETLLPANESDGEQETEITNKGFTDYEAKNLERLREIQERRKIEAQLIEESRNKMKRKQEKLKDQILKEAAEYKAIKA
jgi:hypothetical protein